MTPPEYKKIQQCIIVLKITDLDDLSLSTIKHHYWALTKQYHPDIAGDQYRDGKKFIELKEAYDWITDPEHLSLLPDYYNLTNREIGKDKNTSYTSQQNHYHTPSSTRKYRTPYPAEEVDGRLYNVEKCIWEFVDSSNIRCVYYDLYRKYLFVIFKSSQARVYCYKEVPYETYYTFIHDSSLGAFLNNYIKPRFKCVRMAAVISEVDLNAYVAGFLTQ